MLSPAYEVQFICDTCGRLVQRHPVSAAAFDRLVEEADPVLAVSGPDERIVLDEGDLIEEEEERPVEVLIRHIAVCGRCAEAG